MKHVDEALRNQGNEAQRDAAISVLAGVSLLAQADVLLLLADLLRPPGSFPLPESQEIIELLDAAFAGADSPPLRDAFIALFACAEKTPPAAWSDEYHRLFEGPIACPINETTYVRRDKGAVIADICGFYRAFGFEPSTTVGEKPDHLRCELEFLAALLVMDAQAVERGLDEQADITRQAITRFAADHLADWLASFCARLLHVTALAVYGRLAEALPLVWHHLAAHLPMPELQPGDPESGEHEEIELDPMPCGTGADPACTPAVPAPQQPCGLTVNGTSPVEPPRRA